MRYGNLLEGKAGSLQKVQKCLVSAFGGIFSAKVIFWLHYYMPVLKACMFVS